MNTKVTKERSATDLRNNDLAHHLHPFTDHVELRADGGPRIITHGKGVWLWDNEGKRILDGMAGLWCVNIGYGRQEMSEAARQQMDQLPFYNTFFKTSTEPAIELSERIAALLPPGLEHIFYANSGSEANDTALRLVRNYWKVAGQPQRTIIISRKHAYHGSTIAGASLGGMASMHDIEGIPIPDVMHADAPYSWESGAGMDDNAFAEAAAQSVEDAILAAGPERVAAFIGEPVMGAGGVIIPPAGYWKKVQQICRRYDVLLICDEVICGFGRTGNWFGSQTFNIDADIITMAKGLSSGYQPISAVAVGTRVATSLLETPGRFPHGFTYSGHPVAAAVALANLDILENENIIEYVRDTVGPHLAAGLNSLIDHPLVGEVRSIGAMAAVELTGDHFNAGDLPPGSIASEVRNLCFERGLATRAVRDGLVFSPPLVISTAEIDELVTILRGCLDTVADKLMR